MRAREWNPRATINERGVCFLVAESLAKPPSFFVCKLDFNAPRDPKSGGVQAVVVAAALTKEEANRAAAKFHRESML